MGVGVYRLYHTEPQRETLRISAFCFPVARKRVQLRLHLILTIYIYIYIFFLHFLPSQSLHRLAIASSLLKYMFSFLSMYLFVSVTCHVVNQKEVSNRKNYQSHSDYMLILQYYTGGLLKHSFLGWSSVDAVCSWQLDWIFSCLLGGV